MNDLKTDSQKATKQVVDHTTTESSLVQTEKLEYCPPKLTKLCRGIEDTAFFGFDGGGGGS